MQSKCIFKCDGCIRYTDSLLFTYSYGERQLIVSCRLLENGNSKRLQEVNMNVDALTQKAEEEISALITKKISELRKKTGQEVSEIEFIAREAMTGLEGYEVKIKLI